MRLIIHQTKKSRLAELKSEKILAQIQDFLDLMANANYQGAEKIIIYKHNLNADFFDLKTKTAGEILQKFSTYRQKLAIVGDFSIYTSKSMHDFIRESNRMRRIVFVKTFDEAVKAF